MLKRGFRSGLALIMALCMMFSCVGMTLAIEPEDVTAGEIVAASKAMVEKLTAYAEEINPNLKDSAKAYGKELVDIAKSLAKTADDKLQIRNQVVAFKNDVEALMTKAEELLDEYNAMMAEYDTLMAEYDDLMARADDLQARADNLQAQADDLQVEIDAAVEAGDVAKADELQAEADALEAEADALKAEADALKADAEDFKARAEDFKARAEALQDDADAFQAEVDALKAKVEELKAKLPEGSHALYDSVLDMYDIAKTLNDEGVAVIDVVRELKDAAVVTKDAALEVVQNTLPEAEYTAVADAAKALVTIVEKVATEGGLDANATVIQDAAAKVKDAVVALTALISEEDAAELNALIEELNGTLEDTYNAHTSGAYHIDNDSFYVAMGDGVVVSESYVDKLAAELHHVDYLNLAEKGMQVSAIADVLAANSADIAKADLITLGFGHDALLQSAASLMGEELNWARYVGTTGAAYMEEALDKLTEKVENLDLTSGGADIGSLLVQFIECYTYACISHVVEFPYAVNDIREVNPDALIIVVGMYNPLNNVVLVNSENEEVLAIGTLMDALVETANLYALGYSMAAAADVIYVNAPNVETENNKVNMTVWEILRDGAILDTTNPSENGHVYIQERIYDALDVTGLWGDADENGVVEPNDATYVLEYWAGLRTADQIDLSVSDVDGYVGYEPNDATCILEYWAGLRESFPVEN